MFNDQVIQHDEDAVPAPEPVEETSVTTDKTEDEPDIDISNS